MLEGQIYNVDQKRVGLRSIKKESGSARFRISLVKEVTLLGSQATPTRNEGERSPNHEEINGMRRNDKVIGTNSDAETNEKNKARRPQIG